MDSFPLNCIYLNLSNRCNLMCGHCWLASGPQEREEVDLRAIKQAIEEAMALGLEDVKITGGEPFLEDRIFELVDFLHGMGLSITIETNGTLITGECATYLRERDVSLVCVSLDGARPETHDRLRGRDGSFREATRAIRYLSEQGLKVQVITTLHRENMDELEALLEMLTGFGIDSLSINPLMPSGRGKELFERGLSPSLEELLEVDRMIEKIRDGYPFEIHLSLPLAFRSMGTITEGGTCECNILTILGILGNGDVSICGVGYVERPLVFGSLRREGIGEIWLNSPFLRSFREGLVEGLKGVCGICIFKGICLGYCRANAYIMEGDIMAPYWLCQEAYEKGLFPRTRLVEG